MNKHTWLIDAGHGGMIDGKYVTDPRFNPEKKGAGTKCYSHGDGVYIREGVWNRQVRAKLIYRLAGSDLGYFILNNGEEDIPLPDRCEEANKYHAIHKNCVVVSIHGNASGTGKGYGLEVFTSRGDTPADPIATVFCEELIKEFPNRRFRPDYSDGDPDKEANFYILKHTACPALLTENFFMDRPEDCKFMLTDQAQERIAEAHFKAICRVEGIHVV